MNTPLHYGCIQGNLQVVIEVIKYFKKMSHEQTQDFLYLENKAGKIALTLARELNTEGEESDDHPEAKGVRMRRQIYEELDQVYSARKKQIDETIQTLLEKEKEQLNAAAASLASTKTEDSGAISVASKRSRQSQQQRHLWPQGTQARRESEVDLDTQPDTQSVVQQHLHGVTGSKSTTQEAKEETKESLKEPSDAQVETNDEISSADALLQTEPLASEITIEPTGTNSSTGAGNKQSSKTKSKKKGLKVGNRKVDTAMTSQKTSAQHTMSEADSSQTDEDEFRSAISKTPPKQSKSSGSTKRAVISDEDDSSLSDCKDDVDVSHKPQDAKKYAKPVSKFESSLVKPELEEQKAASKNSNQQKASSALSTGKQQKKGGPKPHETERKLIAGISMISQNVNSKAVQKKVKEAGEAQYCAKQSQNQTVQKKAKDLSQDGGALVTSNETQTQSKNKKRGNNSLKDEVSKEQQKTRKNSSNLQSTLDSKVPVSKGKRQTDQNDKQERDQSSKFVSSQAVRQATRVPAAQEQIRELQVRSERGMSELVRLLKLHAQQQMHIQPTCVHHQQRGCQPPQNSFLRQPDQQREQVLQVEQKRVRDRCSNLRTSFELQNLNQAVIDPHDHPHQQIAQLDYDIAKRLNSDSQFQVSAVIRAFRKEFLLSKPSIQPAQPCSACLSENKGRRSRSPGRSLSPQRNTSSHQKQISLDQQRVSTNGSQGAVQQPIINQQTWPQVLFAARNAIEENTVSSSSPKLPDSNSNQPPTTKKQKQNAAVVENIGSLPPNSSEMDNQDLLPPKSQQPGGSSNNTGPTEMSNMQRQSMNTNNQDGQSSSRNNYAVASANFSHPNGSNNAPSQSAQKPQIGAAQSMSPNQMPIQLFKNLDSQKAQFDFILEQQDIQNRMLAFQLYQHKERINEIEMDHHQRKQDHVMRVNEYYNQANRYYENFRQLETEMNQIADRNDAQLKQTFSLLDQLRTKVGRDAQADSLIQEIQAKLGEIDRTNQKFTEEADFRKEDEKNFIEEQEVKNRKQKEHSNENKRMSKNSKSAKDEFKFVQSKQSLAKNQIQFSNLLVDMEEAYGDENSDGQLSTNPRFPQQVFNKLHDEVILFEESVKSIMGEIDPIKNMIINKVSSFIKQVIPNGEVEIYGSHATKLCLHWSDIDLVLKPAQSRDSNDVHGANGNSASDSGFNGAKGSGTFENNGNNSYSSSTNTRNWLSNLYLELNKNENRSWLSDVNFIENATVPVIKLVICYQSLSQHPQGQLLLPDGSVPRYAHIVSKPINIDITLWSDSHNGLQCVQLVKSYLAESELIEPLVLVMKQMLKVWGFNDAYTGGLSSYALFLMIVSFLQEKRKPALKIQVNLGETLLEFIRYYAQLDFGQYAICCKMPGDLSDKQNVYQSTNSDYNFFLQPRITIDDPLVPSNNVGKSAFRFQEIKSIMCHVYNSVFTGCFCSCHFKSLCQNTSYHQNQRAYHQSQLLWQSTHYSLPQAPQSHLSFQHPPHFMGMAGNPNLANDASMPQFRGFPSSNDMQINAFNANGNQAPNPAASVNQMVSQNHTLDAVPPPTLRTQSQPFQLSRNTSSIDGTVFEDKKESGIAPGIELQGQEFWSNDPAGQCCCDSILSRLIYGYKAYRRTMETLQIQPAGQQRIYPLMMY